MTKETHDFQHIATSAQVLYFINTPKHYYSTTDRKDPTMNATNARTATAAPTTKTPAANAPVRHVHRQRDFGVGYGNSSGYASNRSYASNWVQPRFRFA